MTVQFSESLPAKAIVRLSAIFDGLHLSYRSLPLAVRFFVRPLFYVALGLHLALLFAPLSSETQPPEPEPEPSPTPESVKITRLPPPQKTPQATPKTPPKTAPKKTSTPRPPRTTPPPPKLNPTQPTPQTQPEQEQTAPEAPPENTPADSQTSPDTNQSPPPKTLEDFYRQFPKYPDAGAGSGGVLRSDFDGSAYIYNVGAGVDAVGSQFRNLFASTEFKVAPATTEADFQVYAVTLGPITQYLHLITKDGKTAMVVLAESYTLDQLKTAQTDELDENTLAFETITKQFGSEYGERLRSPDPAQLVEAGQFADTQKFDLRSMTAAGFLQPPSQAEIIDFFAQSFAADGFSLTDAGSYGGGPAYQVTRGDFNRCIIFPATNIAIADGSPGTAVVLADSCP